MNQCPNCGTTVRCSKCDPIPSTGSSITESYELWVDVYQGNGTHDFTAMKAGGVTGIVGKIGYGYTNSGNGSRGCEKDKLFRKNADAALSAGLKYSGYWWTHPLEDWNRQVTTVLEQTKGLPLEHLWVDMEQSNGYGRVWDKKVNKYVWKFQPKISGSTISAANQYILSELDKALEIPIGVYSRTSYFTEFSPQSLEWVKNYPYWQCQVKEDPIITCLEWEAKAKNFILCQSWEEYIAVYAKSPFTSKVYLPKNVKDWDMWQFSIDRVKLPGSDSFLDLNWYKKK